MVMRSAGNGVTEDRITIAGDPVSLGPKMALTLALAVNELGTNSVKYG
ncbi:MAG: sensor histidine kinase, partial [Hyphomicrobiales bacterium]